MIRIIAKQAAILAGLISLVALPPAPAALLQIFDFETGDLSRVGSLELEGPTASVTVSTEVARRGNYSMKAFINKQDKRAEAVSQLRGTVGGINWYGWSIHVPTTQPGDGKFDILAQFHDWHQQQPAWAKDGTAPTCLTLREDGLFQFSLKYQGPVNPATGNPTTVHQLFPLAPATKGEWQDFVVNVRWTHLSTGFLKVWLNGDLLVDYTGPTYLDYGAGRGPYFKMGDYKGVSNWSGTGPRYFHMDEFRMGDETSSYEEVNPAHVGSVVYEGFNYATGTLAGAAGGLGWADAWTVTGGAGHNHVISGGFDYPGLVSAGNRFRIFDTDGNLQTVTRSLSGMVGGIPGTYWISFLSKKNASGRESRIRFGGLEFAALGPDWQVRMPGTPYATLTGADHGSMHLFLARIDAGATHDTLHVWVDPTLSAGEPSTASALVALTDTAFSFDTVQIQYGPNGKSTQSGEWDEIRIGPDFETAVGATILANEADAYVRSGANAAKNYGTATTLNVAGDASGAHINESYIRFDLTAHPTSIDSALLMLTPAAAGASIATVTLQVLLINDDTWTEKGLTWDNRPTAGALLATITGAEIQVGVPLAIDVTSAAASEQAGDGKLSLVIRSTGTGGLRHVNFGSYESGSTGPVLRLR